MAQVLNELQAVVIILYGSISIIQTLAKSSQERVSTTAAVAAAERSIPEFPELDPRKRDAIVDRVLRWVNEDPAARVPWPSHSTDEFGPYLEP
jgi:hypothetical protein